MATARRFGTENSPTRSLLLDAAENLMREEGYHAVTSRKLAERAGLKHQIVHYYFRTMDDLLLAVHERLSQGFTKRLDDALGSENPILALWEIASDRHSAALEMEFMALANHRKEIRRNLARTLDDYRNGMIETLTTYLKARNVDPMISPLAVSVLTASVGRHMILEESLGVTKGHAEMRALADSWIRMIEGSAKPLPSPRKRTKTDDQTVDAKPEPQRNSDA